MSDLCSLTVNGKTIQVPIGENLVDAAMSARVRLPHECCTGQCDTCRIKVISGNIDPQGTAEKDTVLACQATIEGDAKIEYEIVPDPISMTGAVSRIAVLSGAILEVVVAMKAPFEYLPGQYVSAKFAGFPAREYSPTAYMDGTLNTRELVFHIKRLRNGRVSSALGETIRIGHKVQITGPYGRAYLRQANDILVLVAGGTGFAPIWSIARAARLTQPNREMILVTGARTAEGLYMLPAINWLSDMGVRHISVTCEQEAKRPILPGKPLHYLPSLGPQDIVYAAGNPKLVEAVKQKAFAANAPCYTDPFYASQNKESFFSKVQSLILPFQKRNSVSA